jgi:uncharacterized OB-fold protein
MSELAEIETIPPIREGLFQLSPPCLLGSQCTACGMCTFPARSFCPACDTDAAPESTTLSPHGRVYSYTIVRQAPGGRAVPYALALIDLQDQVRVMVQLDHPPESIHIGLEVRLILRNIVPAPGAPRLGYAFAATTGANA